MKDIFINVIGYAASIIGVSLMLPQVLKSYTTKSVTDLSWWMLVFYFLNCALWLIYGVLINAWHLILTNAIALIISIVQISLKLKYSK